MIDEFTAGIDWGPDSVVVDLSSPDEYRDNGDPFGLGYGDDSRVINGDSPTLYLDTQYGDDSDIRGDGYQDPGADDMLAKGDLGPDDSPMDRDYPVMMGDEQDDHSIDAVDWFFGTEAQTAEPMGASMDW